MLASVLTLIIIVLSHFDILSFGYITIGLCIASALTLGHMIKIRKTNQSLPQKEKTLKDEIEAIIESRKHVFCPIMKSMCRVDCAAFEMPSVKVISEAPPAHSYISGGICTHAELKHKQEEK